MRDWMFSSVMSGFVPAKSGSSACVNWLEEAADADDFEADAEVGGQCAAVVDGALRGIGAGHADADHVLRAQGFCGNGGNQRGIDAAAQGDERFAEAALAHVVARSQHQRAIGGFGVVLCGSGDRRRVERIDDDQIFFEGGGLRNQFSARIQGQRGAVEDEAVVAAHLVAHEHRDAVAPGNGSQHLAADVALGVPEGRRRQVDVHGGILAHQLFHRIDGVEAARPEVLVVPGIFADGDGQAHAVQFDDLLRPRGQRSSAARRRRRRTAAGACAARAAAGRDRAERRH